MGGVEACPSHPNHSITRICMCESCIEPLCEECVLFHNKIHEKLGYPAQIKPYDGVRGEFKKK